MKVFPKQLLANHLQKKSLINNSDKEKAIPKDGLQEIFGGTT
jgi:hypothetical protein